MTTQYRFNTVIIPNNRNVIRWAYDMPWHEPGWPKQSVLEVNLSRFILRMRDAPEGPRKPLMTEAVLNSATELLLQHAEEAARQAEEEAARHAEEEAARHAEEAARQSARVSAERLIRQRAQEVARWWARHTAEQDTHHPAHRKGPSFNGRS